MSDGIGVVNDGLPGAMMDISEAKRCDEMIKSSAVNLRMSLYEMYAKRGWEALGFSSWQSYLEDVATKAKLTPKTLRKHTRAGLLEAGAGIDIGSISEGVLRPIADTLSDRKMFSGRERDDALQRAIDWADGEDNLTSAICQRAAYYTAVVIRGVPSIKSRMLREEISPETASKLSDIVWSTDDPILGHVLAQTSHVDLAATLYNISGEGDREEVIVSAYRSAHLPGPNGTSIPLPKATMDTFMAYLYEPQRMEKAEKFTEDRSKLMVVAMAARNFLGQDEFTNNENVNWPPTKVDGEIFSLYRALEEIGMIVHPSIG